MDNSSMWSCQWMNLTLDQIKMNCLLFSSCVLAYHHFEDPAEMTRALAQRLKPKGRLMIIDFVDDEGLETIFGQGHSHSHAHIVAHKRGAFSLSFFVGNWVGTFSLFDLGFTSEQMTEMFKSSGLQQVQVDVRFSHLLVGLTFAPASFRMPIKCPRARWKNIKVMKYSVKPCRVTSISHWRFSLLMVTRRERKNQRCPGQSFSNANKKICVWCCRWRWIEIDHRLARMSLFQFALVRHWIWFFHSDQIRSMFEVREDTSQRRFQAASTGDEVYFDRWLVSMRDKGMSLIAIKNEIEKLDDRSQSVLHYSIEYRHWSLVKKLIEVFHCGQRTHLTRSMSIFVSWIDVNLPGRDGETPLHTTVRLDPIHCENMISYFVSHRADISKGDHYGQWSCSMILVVRWFLLQVARHSIMQRWEIISIMFDDCLNSVHLLM